MADRNEVESILLPFLMEREAFRPFDDHESRKGTEKHYAYQDDAGVWTIGYGHTKGVEPGMVWDEEQALAALRSDVEEEGWQKFNRAGFDELDLSPREAATVLSVTFNAGYLPSVAPNATKHLREGNWDGFRHEVADPQIGITKITDPETGKKVISDGLVNRRQWDFELAEGTYQFAWADQTFPQDEPETRLADTRPERGPDGVWLGDEQAPYDPAETFEMARGVRINSEPGDQPPRDPMLPVDTLMASNVPAGAVSDVAPVAAQAPVEAAQEPQVPVGAPQEPQEAVSADPLGMTPAPALEPAQRRSEAPGLDAAHDLAVEAQRRKDAIAWYDLTSNAFRNDNTLGIWATQMNEEFAPDRDFDLVATMREQDERITALGGDQQEIGETLGMAVSAEHFEALMARLERQKRDADEFAQAGIGGLIAALPAYLFDPVDLAAAAVAGPLGAAAKASRLKSAVQAATAAGVSNATIEAYAANNNPYRDGTDVAFAGLAGAFLGGAVGGALYREVREITEETLARDFEITTANAIAKGMADDGDLSAAKRVVGTAVANDDGPRLFKKAAETADEIVEQLPDQEFAWKWVNKLQNNLIGRTFFSKNSTVRRVAASIMEGGFLKDKNATRAATAEGRMHNLFTTSMVAFRRGTLDEFRKWAERKNVGSVKRNLAIKPNEEFYEDVGRALRGKEASPEAASAAVKIRPLLDEVYNYARELEIPGFDGDPVENFFPRYWDDQKITDLTKQVSRGTQARWFKQALLNAWEEAEPTPNTDALVESLAETRRPLDDAVQAARDAVDAAEARVGEFQKGQRGIGEAKREAVEARKQLRAAERELRSFEETADLRVRAAEAGISDAELEELAALRTEVEELRGRLQDDLGNEALRYDLRQAERRLKEAEDPINERLKRGDTRDANADRIANAFVRAIHRRNAGVNDAMQHGLPIDEMDRMRELFEGTGLSDADLESLVDRLRATKGRDPDAGNIRHGRSRLRFDETLELEVATRDGGRRMLSIEDMTVSDASKAIPRYLRTMSGWIGLAKESGIRGQGDIDKILQKAAEDGASRSEIGALRDAFKLITGRTIEEDPQSVASISTRLMKGFNYPRFGGSFGVAQIPEAGGIIATTSIRGFIREMSDVNKLLKEAADGTLDDATAREIDEIIGAGTDYITNPVQRNYSVEDGVVMPKAAGKFDGVNAVMGRLTAVTSLMAPVNAVLERTATRGIMREWGDYAAGTRRLTKAKRARLRGAGMSDEVQDRVFENLRKHGNWEGDLLIEARPHLWDDIEAADAYRLSLDRERRFTVQRNDIGNTGSYIHRPLGRLLTEYMNFMLNSINKQLIRGLHYRDVQTFVNYSTAMFLGMLAYVAQTSIDYANDPKKRRERLETKRIAAAAYQRAGFSAITVPLIDSTLTLAGVDPLFKYGRTSALGTDFVTGLPSYATASDLLYTGSLPLRWALNEDYEFSQQDWERIQRLTYLQRTLGIRNAWNLVGDQLPESSQ